MVLIKIRNIMVDFPFEPYDIQKAYMEKVMEALETKNYALLESPTGKFVCLIDWLAPPDSPCLCPRLMAWLTTCRHGQNFMPPLRVPRMAGKSQETSSCAAIPNQSRSSGFRDRGSEVEEGKCPQHRNAPNYLCFPDAFAVGPSHAGAQEDGIQKVSCLFKHLKLQGWMVGNGITHFLVVELRWG